MARQDNTQALYSPRQAAGAAADAAREASFARIAGKIGKITSFVQIYIVFL